MRRRALLVHGLPHILHCVRYCVQLFVNGKSFKSAFAQFAVKFTVVCAMEGFEGEIFYFSMLSNPSKTDFAVGPLTTLFFYITSGDDVLVYFEAPLQT
jgi:hypothetical protein